jgi:flagellar hook-associated protein 2
MSFTGATTSSTSSNVPQGTLGDVPPVTFPGVASGIDYNAIIQKYTAATQAAEVPYQNQLNNLSAANTEILKIQSLFGKVQDAITPLSNISTFQAYKATVSNTAVATATQISGQNAIPGTYNIIAQTLATSTQISSNTNAAAAANPTTAPLTSENLSVTPTNGNQPNGSPAAHGVLTVNGVQINYDVNSQSLNAIIAAINAAQAQVTFAINGAGVVTATANTANGISLGSASDAGNILQVMHLDTAQYTGSGATQVATAQQSVNGVNPGASFNSTNQAGLQTAVNAGFFTINGVQINVSNTQNVNNVISAINASTAGVTASFNAATNQIVLTNSTPGPQNIVLGAASDTSNFLVAAGLAAPYGTFGGLTNYAGTITTGTQASLTYQNASGGNVTVFNSTNDFTSVIPGIDLKVTASTATPYTVTVASDATVAEKAIGNFVTAYNNAINELNTATQSPTIITATSTQTGQQQSAAANKGGPLYNNFEVSMLRNELVQIVSQFIPTGSTSYNSLQSIGLSLDTSTVSAGTVDANDSTTSSSNDSNSTQNLTATSGRLAALDTSKFEAALAANPTAVQAIFTSNVGLASQLGSQLTTATGLPTFLQGGIAGSVPSVGLLINIENENQLTITSLQQQINLINTEANMQADALRQQFSASETQIAQLQALQAQIAQIGH